MIISLSILDRTGDTRLTWDNADEAEREKARAEVARLKAAGYMFFLVDGSPADEVSAGNGELVARYVSAEELTEAPTPEPPSEPPAQEADAPTPKRRGRPPKAAKAPGASSQKVIAVRPVRGG